MSSISITPEDYQNITIAYLLDLLINDSPTNNEIFNELLKRFKTLGVKSYVLQAFLEMDSATRVKYRMIRRTLMKESNTQSQIIIMPSKAKEYKEED